MLTQRQVQWSEYLFQFNLIIRFCPGYLSTKPNALTRQWTSILKRGILATLQSTLTSSNQSSLKNNLWPLYKLLSSSFFLFMQLQSLIWASYTKISFQLSLVTQLLQNTSLQMANSLWIQIVFFFLTTESMYHLLVISTYIFSSIIMIILLPDITVKEKH